MAFFPHISAYADLADGDTPATPAAGGRHQAGHYTATGGVHLHGLYRLRRFFKCLPPIELSVIITHFLQV